MSKSEERNLIKNKGTEVVFNNSKLLVLLIKDKDASIQYGKGTKWCISAIDDNYFDYYRGKTVTFYFVFQKELSSSNPNYKIAVAVVKGSNEVKSGFECYNAEDDRIQFSAVESLGLSKELFKRIKLSTEQLLDICVDGSYEILPNGIINVKGDVNIEEIVETSILEIGRFGKVTGDFYMSKTGVISLEGSPRWVGGTFKVSDNRILNLKYSPEYVGGDFIIRHNLVQNLDGCTQDVGGSFICSDNRLGKLYGLTGSPRVIKGSFFCDENSIRTLKGSPEIVGLDFCVVGNRFLSSIEGMPKQIGRTFEVTGTNIKATEQEVLELCNLKGRYVK